MGITEVVALIVVAAFFGWMFGFMTFLHRYSREERCYLCDRKVKIKTLLSCEQCDARARKMAPSNLARELYKYSKHLSEVDVYMLNGMIGTWEGKERYQEIDETLMCSGEFLDIFKKLSEIHGDSSIKLKEYKE